MSKEAEKIQGWVDDTFGSGNRFNTQLLLDFLKFAVGKLGYRKIEGEPPLLSDDDEVMAKLWKQAVNETANPMCEYDATEFVMILVATAQWDLDIKFYKEE